MISEYERELALSLRRLLRIQSGLPDEPLNRDSDVAPLTSEEKSQLHLLKPSKIYPIGGDHDHEFRAHFAEVLTAMGLSRSE